MDAVEQHWRTEFIGDPFITFKLKMKILKVALCRWSRETFGDLFKQLTIRDDIVKIKEQLFEEDPSEENRMVLQRAHAGFGRYLHFEEEFWRQNPGIQWHSQGDRNTRSISFYQNQFSQESGVVDSNLKDHIPERISEDQNNFFCAKPTLEEVRNVVSVLSGDSACGPDGFFGVLLIEDLRPISLSNFINNIISRLLHDKLGVILPSLISQNQSGLVKGRNIIENVLLTQELVTDIRKGGKPAIVIIKQDMAKAYDRPSWRFLVQVLRKMGFA
ncbi:uncharacterized protein LOC132624116 [Lycium barbarum]|uniref:uncharacterized protein LOC132624116 n=1 Tax=Lycium barbarum TaxID=112863 RepID=UPI00293E442E|nr:uncharacterized protein LOC132624116 [Lycium barbarum]